MVSTSPPGVFVMTACRALIRPSGEDAMGRSCILDSPPSPGRGMPVAVRMPAVVQMCAYHSRRFKGERPIGAATGYQSQPPRPCANPPPICRSRIYEVPKAPGVIPGGGGGSGWIVVFYWLYPRSELRAKPMKQVTIGAIFQPRASASSSSSSPSC